MWEGLPQDSETKVTQVLGLGSDDKMFRPTGQEVGFGRLSG